MMGHLTRKKIPQTAIKTADEIDQPPEKKYQTEKHSMSLTNVIQKLMVDGSGLLMDLKVLKLKQKNFQLKDNFIIDEQVN